MAKRGRPPKTDVETRPCPQPGHSRRKVVRYGLVKDKSGTPTHQKFLCSKGMEDEHSFRVALAVPKRGRRTPMLTARPYVPPEPCPEHPGGHVVRRGTYKTGHGARQMYECTPPGWYPGAKRSEDREHAKHVFTPVLPRAHVEGDDACPHCAELRAVHRGETAVARKHQADTATVAEALARTGRGETYMEVAAWLQGRLRREGLSPEPRNAWRRAADIVEVFAPVLWADWTASVLDADRQRASALVGVPRVVLLDDMPVFQKATRLRRQRQRFAVLAAAEAVWPTTGRGNRARVRAGRPRDVQLRLLRALPEHSTDAYLLVLAEMVETFGFVPDFVVADGGKGIRPAVEILAQRTGHDIVFITSHFHIKAQLGRAIEKARKAQPTFDPGSLVDDLEHDRALLSRAAWESWWSGYERRLTGQGVPRNGWPELQKSDLYDLVGEHLDAVAPFPDIPRSTGALESLMVRFVKTTMKRRAMGLGNIARTQQLLDMLVLHSNRYFDDLPHVMAALRADAVDGDENARGFVPPVRALSDRGGYRSLLDPDIIDRLTAAQGL